MKAWLFSGRESRILRKKCRPAGSVSGAMRGGRHAFTLVELLVVAAIMSVVTVAVMMCLSSGIRVWETARTITSVEQESFAGFEIMRKDLVNTFNFYGLPFRGESAAVSFPGISCRTAAGREGAGGASPDERRISRIDYYFDQGARALARRATYYPSDNYNGGGEVLVRGVSELRFQYMGRPCGKEKETWQEGWIDVSNRPVAVKAIVRVSGQGGDPVEMERTFVLSSSGLPAEKGVQ